MSRIQKTLQNLKIQGKTALVPYITAGDPKPDLTVRLMHLLVKNGADILELGVPFSDPMADGPVIQKAVERALTHNVSLADVLSYVTKFREKDQLTPVILMGYLNPLEAMGIEVFAKKAKQAGVDGVLTVDMPPEETVGYLPSLQNAGLDRIFLVSPTTPDYRLNAVNEQGSGFIYYVSLKGVTGSKSLNVEEVKQHVRHLKSNTDLPVGIGFGIKNGEIAYQMAKLGDAIIVGSSLVSLIEKNATLGCDILGCEMLGYEMIEQEISEKMQEFRSAIDKADIEIAEN